MVQNPLDVQAERIATVIKQSIVKYTTRFPVTIDKT
jgi:hypothetical protein